MQLLQRGAFQILLALVAIMFLHSMRTTDFVSKVGYAIMGEEYAPVQQDEATLDTVGVSEEAPSLILGFDADSGIGTVIKVSFIACEFFMILFAMLGMCNLLASVNPDVMRMFAKLGLIGTAGLSIDTTQLEQGGEVHGQ